MQKQDDAYAGMICKVQSKAVSTSLLPRAVLSQRSTQGSPTLCLLQAQGMSHVMCGGSLERQQIVQLLELSGGGHTLGHIRPHKIKNYNAISVLTYPGVTHSVYCVSAQTCQITISFACTPWTGPTYDKP